MEYLHSFPRTGELYEWLEETKSFKIHVKDIWDLVGVWFHSVLVSAVQMFDIMLQRKFEWE